MSAGVVENQDPLIGRVIQGRFKVLKRLAAGGMGVVYQAEQQPLGRMVAFKILDTSTTPSGAESFAQRFLLEASAAAKLGHPNTIVVHDYGQTDDGLFFIAMEFLDGGTLGQRLKEQGPLSPSDAIHVGLQVVSSLRDAHQQGLVHRDLKPGNIMFAPRGGDALFVKVLDFGLVKMVGESDLHLTQSGMMMGSPRYMAPEQVKAQPCDARTDIYSFGTVLYHMLAGRPPFSAGSTFEAMNHHVYTPPPPLKTTWPQCPAGPQLEAVVMRCLAKEPAHRFQSMDEVMSALQACHAEAGGSIAGAGSYLSVGHGSGDSASYPQIQPGAVAPPAQGSYPHLAANNPYPQHVASAPGTDSNPSISRSGVSPSRIGTPAPDGGTGTYNRTVMFTASQAPPPPSPEHASSSSQSVAAMAVAEPKKGFPVLAAVFGLLVLLLAGVAAVAAVVLLIPAGDDDATIASAEAQTVAAEPEAAEPEPEEPEAAEPEEPEVEQTAPVGEPARPALADIEPVTLHTNPPGAAVRRDGADLGDTPFPLLIPPGEHWTLEVSLDGYETRSVTVASGSQRQLTLNLTPVRAPARPVARPRPRPVIRQYPAQPVVQPVIRPAPVHRNPPGRQVYAPDLDDPWNHR